MSDQTTFQLDLDADDQAVVAAAKAYADTFSTVEHEQVQDAQLASLVNYVQVSAGVITRLIARVDALESDQKAEDKADDDIARRTLFGDA